jgi:hypothetical protein
MAYEVYFFNGAVSVAEIIERRMRNNTTINGELRTSSEKDLVL